jgi:hypothetical protein
MRTSLENELSELEVHLPQLVEHRATDAFVNDLYEAAYYWCKLGRWVVENNTKVNYPERAGGERELLNKLKSILAGKPMEAQAKYSPLLSAGEEILRIVGAVEPPKDGHLDFLKIVRECFQFMLVDFDFRVAEEQPTQLRFSSGKVYLELACSSDPWMSCQFGPEPYEQEHFWIDDLLYMHGDQRYRTLQEKLAMSTETDIREWFRFVADAFKQYGRDVLSNQPGVFERLRQAQGQRDAEYAAAMNALHEFPQFPGQPPK